MKKKTYATESKKKATGYALMNLLLHIILLGLIVQCVWLARMGAKTLVEAKMHIFIQFPNYDALVGWVKLHPALTKLLNPLIWPYVVAIVLVLMLNAFFSIRAARALAKGRLCSS